MGNSETPKKNRQLNLTITEQEWNSLVDLAAAQGDAKPTPVGLALFRQGLQAAGGNIPTTETDAVSLRITALTEAVTQLAVTGTKTADLAPISDALTSISSALTTLAATETKPGDLSPVLARLDSLQQIAAKAPKEVDLSAVHEHLGEISAALSDLVARPAPTPDFAPVLDAIKALRDDQNQLRDALQSSRDDAKTARDAEKSARDDLKLALDKLAKRPGTPRILTAGIGVVGLLALGAIVSPFLARQEPADLTPIATMVEALQPRVDTLEQVNTAIMNRMEADRRKAKGPTANQTH